MAFFVGDADGGRHVSIGVQDNVAVALQKLLADQEVPLMLMRTVMHVLARLPVRWWCDDVADGGVLLAWCCRRWNTLCAHTYCQ
jgi:hypothetical protein